MADNELQLIACRHHGRPTKLLPTLRASKRCCMSPSLHNTLRLSSRLLLVAGLSLLSACSTLGYYWQAGSGHLQLMAAREPIETVLQQGTLSAEQGRKLRLAQRAREFASTHLQLPDNDSYTSYAESGRRHLLWTVVATPPLSLEPRRWCVPIAGCISYRGYYQRSAAEALAAQLREEGLDVIVGGVTAYSTLGWFDDPVTDTMLRLPDFALVELLFHELAHQQLYVDDDSAFNEAFATAVAELGLTLWLRVHGQRIDRHQAQLARQRQDDFLSLVRRYRKRLEQLYASDIPDSDKYRRKQQILDRMRADYGELRRQWNGFSGYDSWFEPLNNARLTAVSTYQRHVPAFLALYEQANGNWQTFYQLAAEIGALRPAEREQYLQGLIDAAAGPASR